MTDNPTPQTYGAAMRALEGSQAALAEALAELTQAVALVDRLRAELRGLRATLESAREALQDCGQHTSVCWRGMQLGDTCSCGLDYALAAANVALKEAPDAQP